MKIKISKSQWENIGKTAGWMGGGEGGERPNISDEEIVANMIKQVSNGSEAVYFILFAMSAFPDKLASHLGMKKEELASLIKKNVSVIDGLKSFIHPEDAQKLDRIKDDILKGDYNRIMSILSQVCGSFINEPRILLSLIGQLLGFQRASDLIKRLHDYMATALLGGKELANIEQGKDDTEKVKNELLDRYNKTNDEKEKKQIETMLREFAKFKASMLKKS